MKFLGAFDFDHTIIEENSDEYVKKMLPVRLQSSVDNLYSSDGWTEYMRQIFILLHDVGFTKDDILNRLSELEMIPGFKELFRYINQNDGDVIIISDSNSAFIEHILQFHNVNSLVKKVFTNAAEFDNDGLLSINEYHFQDWCEISSKNLCKGHILKSYIEECKKEGILYDKVLYVGDGQNDYCPSLKLTSKDIVFPRTGYALEKCLRTNFNKVKASVIPWESGYDILDKICQESN